MHQAAISLFNGLSYEPEVVGVRFRSNIWWYTGEYVSFSNHNLAVFSWTHPVHARLHACWSIVTETYLEAFRYR